MTDIAKCKNPTCGARYVKFNGCCDGGEPDYFIKCGCGRSMGPADRTSLAIDWKEQLKIEGKISDN
jgi:hypothetical protein